MNLRIFDDEKDLFDSIRESIVRLARKELEFSIALVGSELGRLTESEENQRLQWIENPPEGRFDLLVCDAELLESRTATIESPVSYVIAIRSAEISNPILAELESRSQVWVFTLQPLWEEMGGMDRPHGEASR